MSSYAMATRRMLGYISQRRTE